MSLRLELEELNEELPGPQLQALCHPPCSCPSCEVLEDPDSPDPPLFPDPDDPDQPSTVELCVNNFYLCF